ncbi:RRP4 [Scenedesmus sp. PABB004]|nr:RRP4 [Scenedesmus sp. PABB004]
MEQPVSLRSHEPGGNLKLISRSLRGAAKATPDSAYVCVGDWIDVEEPDFLKGHGTALVEGRLVATLCGVVQRIDKLIYVQPVKSRYTPEVGDVVVGRVTEPTAPPRARAPRRAPPQIAGKRWKVDLNSRQEAGLLISAVNLPGGVQRRRNAEDELNMRSMFREGDLISAEVQGKSHDGGIQLHTRSVKFGKLSGGQLVVVPARLVKKQRFHFTTLAGLDVDVIAGLNGLIWVAPHVPRAEDGAPLQQQAQQAPEQQQQQGAGGGGPSAEQREAVVRAAAAIRALAALMLQVFPESISEAYAASVEAGVAVREMTERRFLEVLAQRETLAELCGRRQQAPRLQQRQQRAAATALARQRHEQPPARAMAGNAAWDALPTPIVTDVLLRAGTASWAPAAAACRGWRAAVQAGAPELSPRSVQALRFVGGCGALRALRLGAAQPVAPGGALTSFAHVAGATALTLLDLASSSSAAWRGRVAALPAADLAAVTALSLLQELDLSHQPLLAAPDVLAPLTALAPHLTRLALRLAGAGWRLHASAWRVLSSLTHLRAADLAGCARCEGTLAPAPLEALSTLVDLQQLCLADWEEAPSAAGMRALAGLPSLAALDLSRCLEGGGTAQPPPRVPLLALLLGGSAPQLAQERQRSEEQGLALLGGGVAGGAGPFFGSLVELRATACRGLSFSDALWARLSSLQRLDLSGAERLAGEGLARLAGRLQSLVLQGCAQLDYDALAELLRGAGALRTLDLSGATVILAAAGATGQQLLRGHYRPPPGAPRRGNGGGGGRRDVAGPGSAAPPQPPPAAGLRVLAMTRCGLALAGLGAWHALPDAPLPPPADPGLLLLDLVAATAGGGLGGLRTLRWGQASSPLLELLLCAAAPCAAPHLEELELCGGVLPPDPSRCWAGLAAATRLRRLDVSQVGFARQGGAVVCGANPTVSLLRALAGMRGLEELRLAGWRFFFADLHALANLHALRCLDLSGARDVGDQALWSLTHLRGLTQLRLGGAAAGSPHTWGLVFSHMPHLACLDLSGCAAFTSASVAGLLQLTALTALDIRGTGAGDEAAVELLARLPGIRRLALTLAPPSGGCCARRPGGEAAAAAAAALQPEPAASSGAAGARGSEGGGPPPSLLQQLVAHLGHSRISHGPPPGAAQQPPPQPPLAPPCAGALLPRRRSSGSDARLEDYDCLALLGRGALRQLELGAGPAVAEHVRALLPAWVEVR